jgi:ribosome-associated protein
MEMRKLQELVVSALEDIKGRNIEVINTTGLSPMFDSMIIATGDSNRQVRALARNVEEKAGEAGVEVLSIEGEESGEWVLVDLGDLIVHVMQPTVRQFYNLEELWKTTPAQRRKAMEQVATK